MARGKTAAKSAPKKAATKAPARRKRSGKDPNAPKRPLSAFFWFCNDERPKVKAAIGDDSSVGEVAKELGKRWQVISATDKNRYQQLADKDKARYDRDMAAYNKKSGKGAAGGSKAAPKSSPKKKTAAKKEESEPEEDDDDEEEEDEDDE